MAEVITLHSNRVELWSGTIKGEAQPTWFIDLWDGGGCCTLGDNKDYRIALADAEEAARDWSFPLLIKGRAA